MPTARKAAAKKTTARKITAPRQTETEKAVEAALKVYKSRVADQVRHYQETGDLCDEEYRNVRRELDLEGHLESKDSFRLQLDVRGTFETEGGCGDVFNSHQDDIGDAVVKLLEQGFEIRCGGGTMTVKVVDTNVWSNDLQEWG